MVINHFTEVEQYRIYRVLLELYKTDEENWEPYIPLNGSDEKTDNDTKETLENTSNDDEDDNFTKGFSLRKNHRNILLC